MSFPISSFDVLSVASCIWSCLARAAVRFSKDSFSSLMDSIWLSKDDIICASISSLDFVSSYCFNVSEYIDSVTFSVSSWLVWDSSADDFRTRTFSDNSLFVRRASSSLTFVVPNSNSASHNGTSVAAASSCDAISFALFFSVDSASFVDSSSTRASSFFFKDLIRLSFSNSKPAAVTTSSAYSVERASFATTTSMAAASLAA